MTDIDRDAARYRYIRKYGFVDWEALPLPPAFIYSEEADEDIELMTDEAIDACMDVAK